MGAIRVLAKAGLLLAAACVLGMGPALAQVKPGATIRLVYPYAPGGSADGLARIVAERLAARLKVSAIVENKSGASGRIGVKSVIQSTPDGTTLLFSPLGPAAIHPLVYANLDFDPFVELVPVSQVATFDIGLALHPDVPAKSVAEFVAWAKGNPDKATFAIPGAGGLPHFFGVMFATEAKVAMKSVLYRGSAAAVGDLTAGHVPAAMLPAAEATELHRAGKARLLATSGATRSNLLPDVATFRESGYELTGQGWFAVFAPQGTPAATIAQLSGAIQELMGEASVQERVLALGLSPTGTTAAQLGAIQKADYERWAPAVKASGFTPDQ
ncbi:MAG: hypothetical protein JWN93_458 [Hyphomicrobiales bacterium]|nr:hypothetical protein [Hyphomicrobiales bacterium]